MTLDHILRKLLPFHRAVVYATVADKAEAGRLYVEISKYNDVDIVMLKMGAFRCALDLESPETVVQLIMEQVKEVIHDRTFVLQSILSRPDVIREFNIKSLMDFQYNLTVILNRLKHIRSATVT